MSKSITLLIAIMLLSVLTIHAEVPQLINYQGALNDADNNPVTAQNLSVVFTIYDSETEGASLWSETQSVNVTDGVFNVLLGSVTPIPYEVFDGSDRYLSMKIGEDSEMTPRKHLVSVGNAFHAHTADNVAVGNYVETINGVSPNESGNIAIVAGDNVDVSATSSGIKISATGGEGFTLPYYADVEYDGPLFSLHNPSPSGTIFNLQADNILTWNSFITNGSIGENGVRVTNEMSETYVSYCNFPTSFALYFGMEEDNVTITSGGLASKSIGALGVFHLGYNSSNSGRLGTENYGVYGNGGIGSSTSANNAVNSVDNTYAVYGEHESGPYGYIGGDTYSIYGQNGNNSGYLGGGEYGVCGRVGNKAGYLGHNNKAGYFIGDVDIDGDLTVSGRKNFKIDHPLDPENKYLYHYCVESDELSNVYSGNAILNSNGEAVVELPEWFEALNTDFRYQLTAIGAPGPNLFIAQEISANQFKIAGGQSGMKVSWTVRAIRNDPSAKSHPAQPVQEKTGDERGKYLDHAAYNHPQSMGIAGEHILNLEQEYKTIEQERQNHLEKERKLRAKEAEKQAEEKARFELEQQRKQTESK